MDPLLKAQLEQQKVAEGSTVSESSSAGAGDGASTDVAERGCRPFTYRIDDSRLDGRPCLVLEYATTGCTGGDALWGPVLGASDYLTPSNHLALPVDHPVPAVSRLANIDDASQACATRSARLSQAYSSGWARSAPRAVCATAVRPSLALGHPCNHGLRLALPQGSTCTHVTWIMQCLAELDPRAPLVRLSCHRALCSCACRRERHGVSEARACTPYAHQARRQRLTERQSDLPNLTCDCRGARCMQSRN